MTEGVSVKIDPCRINGGNDGQCDGYRVSVTVNALEIARGTGKTIADAVQWCAHGIRKNSERALAGLLEMGFNIETPQAVTDKLAAKAGK